MRLVFLILTFIFFSCSPDEPQSAPRILHTYNSSPIEIDLMNRVNHYRDSLHLKTLIPIQELSYICFDHNLYMVENNTLCHCNFEDRVTRIQFLYRSQYIGEVIAYNYQTSKSVLQAWKSSPEHNQILIGDEYTHFGCAITQDSLSRNYISMILIKK